MYLIALGVIWCVVSYFVLSYLLLIILLLSRFVAEYLDSALFDFWLQYFLLAHGLIFSAFNVGFEDANIPFGPVEGTRLLHV